MGTFEKTLFLNKKLKDYSPLERAVIIAIMLKDLEDEFNEELISVEDYNEVLERCQDCWPADIQPRPTLSRKEFAWQTNHTERSTTIDDLFNPQTSDVAKGPYSKQAS